MNRIKLYHGGSRTFLDSCCIALDPERSFYCSRDKSIANQAAFDHGCEGSVRYIAIPHSIFRAALAKGLFEERPYAGALSEGSTEIIIRSGKGIHLLNLFFLLENASAISERKKRLRR